MKEVKVIWEVWYTYSWDNHSPNRGSGQVNTAAYTIEEAIAHVQSLEPEENRSVYKIEDKGSIV